jgi:two-component system, LytTR family, response regulator
MLKAIIIDDEEASRTTLRNFLKNYCPQVELIGEVENINDGHQLIKKASPDLVFLDIEMPFGNAFDLLEKFENIPFETIFVTAFSQYALQAIHLSACSYILKPVNIDDLIDAVKKVEQNLAQKNSIRTANVLLENLTIENKQLKKIVLPTFEGFDVVTVKEIIRCEANDNLTDVYLTDDKKKTVCKTLKHFEDMLSDFDFFRTHKSHLINLNFVASYHKGKGGEIILSNGFTVPLSVTKKEGFVLRFK